MATDKDLYDRARKGDDEAAARLLDRHNRNLIRWLRGRIPTVEVEDVAQEAWIRALTTGAGFNGDGSFEGWLRTIASRIRLRAHELEHQPSSSPTSPSRMVLRGELRQAIANLDAEHRELAWSHWVEGKTHEAIAAQAGIRVGTVHSRLRLARQRLEQLLRPGSST